MAKLRKTHFGAGTVILNRIINLFSKGDKELNQTEIGNLICYKEIETALSFLVKYKFLKASRAETKSPKYSSVFKYRKGALMELWTQD